MKGRRPAKIGTATAAGGKLIQLDDYDRKLGIDELNLAEWPLASLASRLEPGQNTLAFEDDVFDEGQQKTVHRSLVITGSEHFGLPTASDNDVLLVLVHLTNVRNAFKAKQVTFSRYELVKFLGWDLGGRSYVRLHESLQRWTSVTLHFKHAWWQRSAKRWRSRSFHVIEALELRGRDEIGDDGLSRFSWSDVIFDSFVAGNLRRINLDTYFRLESAVARQIFRFAGKRFHRARHLTYSLREFACEHIGLSRSYDNFDLKRKLQPALEELEAIGFLAPMPYERRYVRCAPGRWEIALVAPQLAAAKDAPSCDVVRELTRRGVSTGAAENLAKSFPKSYIADKLALHDQMLEQKDRRISRNPAGFLASAIRHDFQSPSANIPQRTRKAPAPLSSQRQPIEGEGTIAADESARLAAVRRHLESLDADQVVALEQQAMATANCFKVQTYERLRASGGPLWEQVRLNLLGGFLEQVGKLPKPTPANGNLSASTQHSTNNPNAAQH